MELQHQSPEQAHASMEKTKSQPQLSAKSAGLSSSKKRARNPFAIRRSERIQNAVMLYQNHDIQPVAEEITVSESEEEDEPPSPPRENLHPPACKKTLIEKIDHAVQLLETQERIISALKLKDDENPLLSECLSPPDVRYKSLYNDSQKKIQVLMDENRQLTQKLETALGKVEAYEKGSRLFSEVLEKLKDVILISNLTKVTETAVNASSQAIRDAMTTRGSVRKGRPVKGASAAKTKRKKITDVSEGS